MVVGGMCRSPGPRVRVPFFDFGRDDSGIMSPGRTKAVDVAIWRTVLGVMC